MKKGTRIGLYFGLLALTGGLADPSGGLADLPLLFILKDHLHLGPQTVALFGAITLAPRHIGFVFGLCRDRWRPARLGDRAYFLFAAIIVVCCYLWLVAVPVSFFALLSATVIIALAFQFFDTSAQALLTIVGQRQLMTGQLSALMEIADNAVSVIAVLAGGWLVVHASPRTIFLIVAGIAVLMVIQSFWNPPEIFRGTAVEEAHQESGLRALGKLIIHRMFWPTLAILVLYNFSPGWGTPFFYYLTTHLRLSSETYGACRAATYAAVAAATVLYGVLCYRQPLRNLLWWAIVLNIFPGFLFLVIGSSAQAVAVSAIGGLITGFGNIAVFDLLMRSCPRKMEGTASMLGFSIFSLAGTFGDVFGAWIYQRNTFALCIILDAIATVLILPFLLRLPAALILPKDGESVESLEAQPG